MINFELPNSQFDYLMNILEIESIKNQILLSLSRQFTCTYFRLTVDDYVDLLEFVDDKQIEIGFDNWNSNDVTINKDGEILESIRDYLFLQGEREITN